MTLIEHAKHDLAGMTTYHPTSIYIEIDVSGLPLIDAERYYRYLRGAVPVPIGCNASAELRMVAEIIEE